MKRHQFKFTGKAKEYFGIWIVNLFLSIITLGIYSAWAKVRRMRYFYANTYLDGHNFEYHANPKSILIGRVIVFGVLLVYNGLVFVTPLAGILVLPYLALLPWVLNKAIRFKARVSSYRNIRFNFEGTYWRAFLVFVIMPLVGIISLGILVPLASRMASNYFGNNLKYGTSRFATSATAGALYGNWFASIFFFFAGAVLVGIALFASGWAADGSGLFEMLMAEINFPAEYRDMFIILLLFGIGAAASILLVPIFYRAGVRNIAYNYTVLDKDFLMRSSVGRFKYVWILISNLILSILTVGLLRPWAAIRTWRFLADHTGMETREDLGRFIGEREEEGAAVSAEFLDIEGIDFGL